MKVFSAKLPDLSQTVNSLGKYLYNNLSGAFKYKKSSNMFDIWTVVLYQIPHDRIKKYKISEDKYKDVYEMVININITTYQEKIRFNLIEESPDEFTIGCKVFNLAKLRKQNPNNQVYFDTIKNGVMDYLIKRLEIHYADFDFLF